MFSCTWKYFARLHSDEPLQNHKKTSVLDEIHTYSYELSTKERVHHLNKNNLWVLYNSTFCGPSEEKGSKN